MAAATSSAPAPAPAPAVKKVMPYPVIFGIAGASGMSAWCFSHPLDLIKVRMQLMEAGKDVKPSPIAAARNIVHSEGILGLFAGLPAGLARQAVYTTLRVGLYDIIRPLIVKNGEQPNMGHRAASGLIAGGIASFMTCPVEICMVRMQGDGRLPPSERRNYKSFFDALVRIPREEGLFAYWKGASPTVFRAMVVSMTQLGTYDQVKSMLLPTMGDGFPLHVVSAVSAAVVYSYASLPLDTVKTRMQSAKATDGKATIVGSLKGIIRDTGVKGLWTGFGPYFARSATHTLMMFIFKEAYDKRVRAFAGYN